MKVDANTLRTFSKKPVVIAAAILVAILLVLAGIKVLQIASMISAGKSFSPAPETITTTRAQLQKWETSLHSVGSLTAVNGVTISAEQSGNIERIAFTPGSMVAEGDLLVQQDVTTEEAQYRAALATAELAKINLKRSKNLIKNNLTSRSEYDAAVAQYDNAVAQADNFRSLINEKTIRAPFAGKIGVQNIYAGQYLRAGEPIVSLQSLDPMYVNFKLPQRYLAKISSGLTVRIETDVLPSQIISGVLTAINSEVDTGTRNVAVQASLANTEKQLLPGMFVEVTVVLPEQSEVLSIPATSIVHAPYGASVYVADQKIDEETGAVTMTARQQFVKLGESRGDFIAVTSGLKDQDLVVSTGGFKLYNGQSIVENNELAPKFELDPKPDDQ